jgi:NAD(P)-dependent dehydrogenase (short-subunit alcohol dehydrogenase family)
MSSPSSPPVCVVVGIGPGNGAAFARRFSAEGYRVALLARKKELSCELEAELKGSKAYVCDVGDAKSVETTFKAIPQDLGDIDVVSSHPPSHALTGGADRWL